MNSIKIAALAILSIILVVCAIVFAVNAGREPADTGLDPPFPEIESLQIENQGVEIPKPAASQSLENLSRKKVGWGMGLERNEKNQPILAVQAQQKYSALGGYFILPNDTKRIYLTFDLGYDNGNTEVILDALDARGVKATFFVTMPSVEEVPDLIERMVRTGHTVGNHTVNHPSIPDISDSRIRSELMDLHEYVEQTFGYTMTLFRNPKGEFSEYTLKLIDDLGYKSIFWSFAYVDWNVNSQPDRAQALTKLQGALHDGAIYLLHAVSSTNAAILGDFIDGAVAQGYQFGLLDYRLGLVGNDEIFY